jgi:hypothetical protein
MGPAPFCPKIPSQTRGRASFAQIRLRVPVLDHPKGTSAFSCPATARRFGALAKPLRDIFSHDLHSGRRHPTERNLIG